MFAQFLDRRLPRNVPEMPLKEAFRASGRLCYVADGDITRRIPPDEFTGKRDDPCGSAHIHGRQPFDYAAYAVCLDAWRNFLGAH